MPPALSWFDKPSPEDEALAKAAYELAKTRNDIVSIAPLKTVADFVSLFTNVQGCHYDRSAITSDAALNVAAEMKDWNDDAMLAWASSPQATWSLSPGSS